MIKIAEINTIHVPSYRELVVKRVYPELKGIENLMKYIPDYPDKVIPEKFFFYSILATFYPYNTENLIKSWRTASAAIERQGQIEKVEATPQILEEINNLLLHSSKQSILYLIFLFYFKFELSLLCINIFTEE